MRMTASDRKLFPQLYRYLRDSMLECAHISLVVNNLVAYGGMTVPQPRHALHWGRTRSCYSDHVTPVPSEQRVEQNGNMQPHKPPQHDRLQTQEMILDLTWNRDMDCRMRTI